MILAADYPLMDIIWTMIVFFGWVIWIWTLVMVLSDVFRSGMSGFSKALWTFLVIVLPLFGVLMYLIAHGEEMGERRARDIGSMLDRANTQEIARATAANGGGGPAAEIERARKLLDAGAINEQEYAQLKSRVLH
jgi:Phospholipase_D-nuclease N-terminal